MPLGGLLAAGSGTGIGLFMALVAIVALAWLPLWVGVVVGSAVSTSRSMPARRLTPDTRLPDTKGHDNSLAQPEPDS